MPKLNSKKHLILICILLSVVTACAVNEPAEVIQVTVHATATGTKVLSPTEPLETPTATLSIQDAPVGEPSRTPDPSPTATSTPSDPHAISPANAVQLVELAQFGKGSINFVAWAADSSFFAVSSATSVYLYDGTSMAELNRIEVGSGIGPVSISPDGRRLAAPGSGSDINLWDTNNGQLISTLRGVGGSSFYAFSPDGALFAAADVFEEGVQLWEIDTGKHLTTLTGITDESIAEGIPAVDSLAFSPDGKLLAAGRPDTRVLIWDVTTSQLLHSLAWLEDTDIEEWGGSSSVVFSPDGEFLANYSMGNAVRIWDVSSGQIQLTLEEENHHLGFGPGKHLAYDSEGKTLVEGSGARWPGVGVVRTWDLGTAQLKSEVEIIGAVRAISPDGQKFISERKGVLYLGDTQTGGIWQKLEGHTDIVRSISFSPDSSKLLTGGWGGVIRIWEVKTGSVLQTIEADTRWIFSLEYSPDGTTFVTGEGDPHYRVRIWDSYEATLLKSFYGHTELIFDVSFSPNGNMIASGGSDDTVRLWNPDTGLRKTVNPYFLTRQVEFSPDGAKILVGSRNLDGIPVIDPEFGQLITTLRWNPRTIFSIAFDPNRNIVAIGEDEYSFNEQLGRIRVGDVETRQVLYTLVDNVGRPLSLDFSPDGRLLAAAIDDTIQLWDMETGQHLLTLDLTIVYGNLTSVEFSSDGRLLAAGGEDGTVHLWGIPDQ